MTFSKGMQPLPTHREARRRWEEHYLQLSVLPLWSLRCCSVAESCLTLCDPMDCSMAGFPVLPCPSSSGACSNSCPLSRWYHPTISSSVIPFSSCPQSFPALGSFLMSQLFASGGQSTGASASASVLPMNIQGWFPLWLTGLISLLSKELLRVFSSTTVWQHQFFSTQFFFYDPTITCIYDY